MTKDQQLKTQSLPSSPGIYLFKDKNGRVLYAGKAGNLRNRVRSYFNRPTDLTPHKQMMVKKVADIETVATSNEAEALILESVLIKKHHPPYNVVLKDDKNYQFIKIDYRLVRPTVTTVRRPELDRGRSQARYFGPYTSASELYEGLRLLRRIFPWRKKPKEPTRFEQDLLQKRTLGPLPRTNEEYQEMITGLTRMLEGKSDEVINELAKRMTSFSSAKQFEQAAGLRNQITAIKHIQAKQKIISLKGESQDVVSVYRQDDPSAKFIPSSSEGLGAGLAAVNVFVIRAGKLIDKLNFMLQHVHGENDTAVLDAFLKQYYSEAANAPKEIVIPLPTSLTASDLFVIAREPRSASWRMRGDRSNLINARNNAFRIANNQRDERIASARSSPRNDMKITIPHHGKKRDLIKLGEENARQYLEQSLASWEKGKNEEALIGLKQALRLSDIPRRIEGYDISNIQGKFAVGSMVVFINGLPDKNEYRKFKIKTVTGANDPWMLAEVLKRRFAHADWQQPDLVLLDGGKGQLATVLRALSNVKSQLSNVSFIALAKREEEIFQGVETPHWGVSTQKINLAPRSPASLLLQRVRDEAHRFAQAYYHLRRSKALVTA